MSPSIAAFAQAIRPMIKPRHFPSLAMIKPRHFSSLASSLAVPRALAPKTLTPSSILSRISVSFASVPFASTKAVYAVDKIRRTDGDGNLLRVLENEIKCVQEAVEQALLEAELPKDSPFEIIDIPRNEFKLKREFQGEKIEVFVSQYYDGDADEKKSKQDAAEGQNTDDYHQSHISLIVTIDKAGPTLKFWCNLYAEDFKISSMTLSEDSNAEEHYLSNFDEGWQTALNKYLRLRGIKVSLYKFLREYYMARDNKKYIVLWKKMKEFIEK